MTSSARAAILLIVVAFFGAGPTPALSQDASDPSVVRVRVVDIRGHAVPHALVEVVGGVQRIADDSGHVSFRMKDDAARRLRVRRLGFREFFGVPLLDTLTAHRVVVLSGSVAQLDTVRVAARSSPLERSGFYDRVARVQSGAMTAEFITPEELEARGAALVSSILQGRRSVRVARSAGARSRPILLGRGGTCGMTIVIDGMRINGVLEQTEGAAVATSIVPRRQTDMRPDLLQSIDELVDGRSVAAIEIYPSTANAPAELIPLTGGGSCGIVAIWTGARQ